MEIAWLAAVPISFHRGNFNRLIGQSVEPLLIAEQELCRREYGNQCDCHLHHDASIRRMAVAEQIARPYRKHEKSRRR
jgi:hypothetical protein